MQEITDFVRKWNKSGKSIKERIKEKIMQDQLLRENINRR